MLTFGQKACAEYSKSGLSTDQKLGMTYYDASRVYYQIADYTGDSSWTNCESKAEAVYKGYVNGRVAACPGLLELHDRLPDGRASTPRMRRPSRRRSRSRRTAAYCGDGTPLEWTADPSGAVRSLLPDVLPERGGPR
jgi:hypothetical protein